MAVADQPIDNVTPAPVVASSPVVSGDAYTMNMFNHKMNAWQDVPAHQVDDAVHSGQFSFNQGMQVPVISPDGQKGTIPAEFAKSAWSEGYTYATPQRLAAYDQQQADASKQRISGDQPLTAAIAGAARTASLGVSSVALHAAGLSDVERTTAELNPVANTAGEIAGVVAPALLSGGMAGAARLGLGRTAMGLGMGAEALESANLAGNVASRVGGAAAKATTAVIGESMPARIVTSIAKNAAEGAVYGTGSAIGETAMGSPNDLYDNLASHVTTGAMIGGSLGGVFGIASEAKPAVTKLLSSAADTASNVVQGAAQKAVALSGRAAGLSAEEASQAGQDVRSLKDYIDSNGNVGNKALAGTDKDVQAAEEIRTGLVRDTKQALKGQSAGAGEQFQARLQQTAGDIQAAEQSAHVDVQAGKQTLQDLMLADKQPLTDAHVTQLTQLQKPTDVLLASGNRAAKSLGQDIDAILGTNVQTQGEAADRFFKIADMTNNVIKASMPEEEAAAIRKIYLDAKSSFLSHGNDATVSAYHMLQDNQTAAQAFSELAQNVTAKAMKVPTVLAENGYQTTSKFDAGVAATWLAKAQNRQVVNDTLALLPGFKNEIEQISKGVKSIDDLLTVQSALKAKMSSLKPSFTGEGEQIYNTLKMTGVDADTVDKLALHQQVMANPNATAMDKVLSARSFLGKPVSEDMKKLAEGQAAMDRLNALKDKATWSISPTKTVAAVKTGGSSLLYALPVQQSTLGKQIGSMAKVMQKAEQGAKVMKAAVGHTADALTGNTTQTMAKAVGVSKNDAAPVIDLRKNYQNVANQLSTYQHAPSALASVAPVAAQVIDQKHQQIVQYLQSKLPQDPLKDTSIMFNKSSFLPSDQQLASFNRTVNAVNNPIHALMDLADNGGSRETIDALKTIYPNVLQKVHDAVLDNLIKNPQDLSYQQKLNLSSLFGVPTDYSLQPQVIQRMQQTFADAQQQQGRPQGSPSKSRTVKIDVQPLANMATDSQKTTYGLQDS